MSKIIIPTNLKGKELYKFLVENKSALIKQKKSVMKRTDPVCYSTMFINAAGQLETKGVGDDNKVVDTGITRVKVAMNTALFCDSQMDVLLPDSAKKSMKERKGMIPHIHDHKWEVEAELGDVQNIYYQDLPIKDLGYNKSGTAQALIFETDIRKDYNEKLYTRYKAGKIKQHSIGLFYVTLELAINDPEYEKEIDFWNKYYDQVINKEVIDESGYFWVVSEYKLMEGSAVLFGSNILTPTLEIDGESTKSTEQEPTTVTSEQPHTKTESVIPVGVDWEKIANKLIN